MKKLLRCVSLIMIIAIISVFTAGCTANSYAIKVGNKTSGDAVLVLGGLTMQDYIALPYLDEAVEGVKTVQKTTDDLYN